MDESENSPAVHGESDTRQGAALIVDIAGTVDLRTRQGDVVAGERIRKLLADIIAVAGEQGGEFIKSYGDDVLAIFEGAAMVASAAHVAIQAQCLARAAGLQLYAGFHAGDIEFRETMGHPDALGLTVNIAARLHKLTEGAPGRIFAADASVRALPPELRALASPYGTRDLKGVGSVEIWTLEWQGAMANTQTLFAQTASLGVSNGQPAMAPRGALLIRHVGGELRLEPERTHTVGRGTDAALRIPDLEARVSSMHLQLEFASGHWFVRDISRNGTWLRDGRTSEITPLPKGWPYALPSWGELCLGRKFESDADGHFTLSFETVKS